VLDDELKQKATCRECQMKVSYNSNRKSHPKAKEASPSNLWKHMKAKHSKIYTSLKDSSLISSADILASTQTLEMEGADFHGWTDSEILNAQKMNQHSLDTNSCNIDGYIEKYPAKEREPDATDPSYVGFHGFGEPNEICISSSGKSINERKIISKHKKIVVDAKITSTLQSNDTMVQKNHAKPIQNSKVKANVTPNKLKRTNVNVHSENILNREVIRNEDRKHREFKKSSSRNKKRQSIHVNLTANNSQSQEDSMSLFKNDQVDSVTDNIKTGNIACNTPKTILRPSKLGTVTDASSSTTFGNFSSFGQSVTDRKSKRQCKPSLKMQQHVASSAQKGNSLGSISKTGAPKFGQTTFGSPLNISSIAGVDQSSKSDDVTKQDSPGNSDIHSKHIETSKNSVECNEKTSHASDTRWGPRLRKIENKFVKSGNRVGLSPSTVFEHRTEDRSPLRKEEINTNTTVSAILGSSKPNNINDEDKHIDIENKDSSNSEKLKKPPPVKLQPKPIIRQTKFRNRNHELISNELCTENRSHSHISPPLIRESRLKLNQEVLEQLRVPSQQVEFYQAIQGSMQSAERKPPRLIDNLQNPAGTALVSYNEDAADKSSKPATQIRSPKYPGGVNLKPSNRMPGHIVCGICGAVRYYSFILQAKKFGTFSCEPCRKFISKCIRMSKDASNEDELFTCVTNNKDSHNSSTETTHEPGMCVVPPVIRKTPSTPHGANRKGDNNDTLSSTTVRCQACWLKLCLIGYNLEPILYDKLRLHLSPKDAFRKMLPISSERQKSAALLPHRGKILEFNRQVPLSRPLFDGFGIGGPESSIKVDALDIQHNQLSDSSISITEPNVKQTNQIKNKNIEGDVRGNIP
jgi:hypothetical protein